MLMKNNGSGDETDSKPLAALGELQEVGFANLLQFNSAWVRACGEIGAEMASFVADRVREDIKTQQEFLDCSDIGEMQEVQRKFFERAVEQYQAQGSKMLDIGTRVLRDEEKSA